jgi:LCP family protein required for cell wall assembly
MARRGAKTTYSDSKTTKKKKMKKGKKIILTIIAAIIVIIACILGYIYSKFGKINFEALNKDDLAINDVYNDVSDSMSEDEFNSVKSIVFFGTDSRDTEGDFSGRSDTIMIASINPTTKSISLVSIPRDTYVEIPGYGKDKINHAYAFGKEQLAIKTINSNFGLNIKEYVTIDFVGLIHIINKVGGIELNITNAEKDYINQCSVDSYKLTGNPVKKLTSSGKVTLSGEQALTHSRNRTIGNDFIRASRQRTVLEALITKLSSLGVNGILSASDSILKDVKTNVNVTSYIGTLTNIIGDKSTYLANMSSNQVPGADYSAGKTINGVYYFTTDYDKAKTDFIKYIYGE